MIGHLLTRNVNEHPKVALTWIPERRQQRGMPRETGLENKSARLLFPAQGKGHDQEFLTFSFAQITLANLLTQQFHGQLFSYHPRGAPKIIINGEKEVSAHPPGSRSKTVFYTLKFRLSVRHRRHKQREINVMA